MVNALVVILKVLVLALGLGLLFGGGACLAFLVPEALRAGNGGYFAPFLLISLVVAGVGLLLVLAMIRALRRRDKAPASGVSGGDSWPDGR